MTTMETVSRFSRLLRLTRKALLSYQDAHQKAMDASCALIYISSIHQAASRITRHRMARYDSLLGELSEMCGMSENSIHHEIITWGTVNLNIAAFVKLAGERATA